MNPIVVIFAPVVILGVPVYFVSKYLEKRMRPRRNFKAFILWVLMVLGVSFAWYLICIFTFFKFFSLKS